MFCGRETAYNPKTAFADAEALALKLDAETEAHAALQVRCFDYGNPTHSSIFDEVKELRSRLEQRDREFSDLSQLCHLKLGEIKTLEGRLDAEQARNLDLCNAAQELRRTIDGLDAKLQDCRIALAATEGTQAELDAALLRLSAWESFVREVASQACHHDRGVTRFECQPTCPPCRALALLRQAETVVVSNAAPSGPTYERFVAAPEPASEKCERCDGTGFVGEYYPGGLNYPCPDCVVERQEPESTG